MKRQKHLVLEKSRNKDRKIMNTNFFTADHHFGHVNKKGTGIIDKEYSNRPFSSIEEMDEALIEKWNAKIKKGDLVYYIGDFAFGDPTKYISRLNGYIYFIIGDHDKDLIRSYKTDIVGNGAHIYKDGTSHGFIYKDRILRRKFGLCETDTYPDITMCHWKMTVWPRSHYNSWHLYAHCLDENTEILTKDGWKYRSSLKESDVILSMNLTTSKLEYNSIDEIIDCIYSGNVYSLQSKGIDFRVTENHVMIDVSRNINKTIYRKIFAKNLNTINRRRFVKSGTYNSSGIGLSDNHIKLLVWIAAEGNLCNSDLVRIRIFKKRKINRIKKLLEVLNIEYNALPQKDNSVSFNFNIPTELKSYKLKPIDNKIEHLDNYQFKIMLEEYTHTDGYKNGKSAIIYTSKEKEADSIQISSIKNGYMCNISKRKNYGYAKKTNYEITITEKQQQDCTKIREKIKVEHVNDEHFWCVKVKNKTIIIRRNGKPLLVGNSHGSLPPIGKSWDVGVDNNNFEPLSLEEIQVIMSGRPDNFNFIKERDRR